MAELEVDRILFSALKKTILFLFFGVLFFVWKRISHFRHFLFFGLENLIFGRKRRRKWSNSNCVRFTWNERQAWDQPNLSHCQRCSDSWYASAINEITSRFTIHRLLEVASRGALPVSIELQRTTNVSQYTGWPLIANPQSAGKTGVLSVAFVESCVSSVQPPLIHSFCVWLCDQW